MGIAEQTHHHLEYWGRLARRTADKLGYPRISSFAVVAETVKAETVTEGRKKLAVTAAGKPTRSVRPLDPYTPREFSEVDAAVSRAPKWAQKVIYRAYVYGQPDRIAAKELRVERETYTTCRLEAVRLVGEMLALHQRVA